MDDLVTGMTSWFGVVEDSLFCGLPSSPDGLIPPNKDHRFPGKKLESSVVI
jgi:hypothetical protein